MDEALLESVRAANQELQQFIELACPDGKRREVEDTVRRLSRVNLRLKHVSKCHAAAPRSFLESCSEGGEIQKYRDNLVALKRIVEKLQAFLLAERVRLNHRRFNVQAASAWADATRACS